MVEKKDLGEEAMKEKSVLSVQDQEILKRVAIGILIREYRNHWLFRGKCSVCQQIKKDYFALTGKNIDQLNSSTQAP